MSRKYTDGVKSVARALALSGFLAVLVSGASPTAVRADYESPSADPPEWYTRTASDGLFVNGVGSDTASGFVTALGALARRMDPNVERVSEELEGSSREKMTRVLAEASFDTVDVTSMSQYYTYRTGSAYSGRSDLRRIVRVEFPLTGDTTCEYRSYLEEIQSEVGTSYRFRPEECDWELLEKTMAHRGIRIVRSEPRLVRHYVRVRVQEGPVNINRNADTATGDTASGKPLGELSLRGNKKTMEREMERNLRDLRRSDTEARNDTSTDTGN